MNYYLNSNLFRGNRTRRSVPRMIIFLFASFFTLEISAQTLHISGQIVSTDGEALIGVNILNESTGAGTTTDLDGRYSIEATAGNWLVYSYIGYTTERRQVEPGMEGNLTLTTAADVLDEVIVVGYGTLRSSKVSTSVSKLSSEDLNNSTFARVDQAMAGKIAGVQVQEVNGGEPGSFMSVKIRGVNSLSNSNDPLYVVDGFPISGNLNSINPQDIESIEILKDAASAAIYGSRGSNGVVLITTKQGQAGKPKINFSSSFGMQQQLKEVGVLNRAEYIEYAIEERTNTAIYNGIDPSTLTSRTPDASYAINPLWISNPESFPDNNWQDLLNRNALISSQQLSFSGKNDNIKYYASFNYLNQEGIIIDTDFERFSFRTNLESKLGRILSVGINSSLSKYNQNTVASNGPTPLSVIRSAQVAPIVGLNMQTQEGGYDPYHAAFILNPVVLENETLDLTDNIAILANPYLIVEPISNLLLKTSLGLTMSKSDSDSYITDNVNRGRGSVGSQIGDFRQNYLTETTVTYNFGSNGFEFNVLGGFSYQKEKNDSYSFEKTGFPDDEIKTLNAGTVINSATSFATEWSMLSYFGRINIDYQGKYILTSSLRRDGSSRFGENNKWGLFPSLSVGWNLDRENFMTNSEIFSSLKLRTSYGSTGNNNIGNYSSTGRITQRNYLDQNETVVTGYSPGTFSNPDLTWETTNIVDFGFDVGFWNDRLNLTLDYYIANTFNLLLNVPIPGITGNTNTLQNIGKVQNKGIELEIKSNIINKSHFSWTSFFNISHNKNIVKELGPTGSPIYGNSRNFVVTKTEIGHSIGAYYMFETDGVFVDQTDLENNPTYKRQEPGDLKYVDQNGDGLITLEEDRVYVGSNLPKFTGGLTNEFTYRDFSLSIFVEGQYGNKLLNITKSQHGQSRGNVYDYWLNRWKSPEQPGDGKTPRAAITENLTTISDFWLEDASYLRIKNVSLAYNLPSNLIKRMKAFEGLRLVFSVDNFYMFDHYYNKAMTANYSNSALVPGVESDGTYPLARTFNLSVNITF